MDREQKVTRILRVLGVLLVLGAVAMTGWTLLIELDDGYAASSAANSICNSERCTPDQLQSMMLIAGPVSVLLFGLFGLAMLKAKVSVPAGPGAGASSTSDTPDVGARLAALDALRAAAQIDDAEYMTQRRRILSSV